MEDKKLITIKGLDKEMVFFVNLNEDLDEIKLELDKILSQNKEFFMERSLVFSFSGNEDRQKINELQKLTVEKGFILNNFKDKVVKEVKEINKTKVIENSLRAGAKVQFDGNVILIGDMNPGSKIEATGSVICLGGAMGVIYAGQNSESDKNFIYAHKLDSPQLKINNIIAKRVSGTKCKIYIDSGELKIKSV